MKSKTMVKPSNRGGDGGRGSKSVKSTTPTYKPKRSSSAS